MPHLPLPLRLVALLLAVAAAACSGAPGAPGGAASPPAPGAEPPPPPPTIAAPAAPTRAIARATMPAGVGGRALFVRDGNLWVMQLDTAREQQLTRLRRGQSVASASWSPDGTRLAFVQIDVTQGGGDLMVMDADGANIRALAVHDQSGAVFETPRWLPDSSAILCSYHVYVQKEGKYEEIHQIERVNLADGKREVVLTQAHDPSLSADGTRMAFLRTTPRGREVWVAGSDGSSPRLVLGADSFAQLGIVRLSPDGTRIAFSGAAAVAAAQAAPWDLGGWLAPVAQAHGLPSDIWLVPSDGGEATRLAALAEDEPYPAWSPDGSHILTLAPGGFYLTDVGTGSTGLVHPRGGYGSIDWIR